MYVKVQKIVCGLISLLIYLKLHGEMESYGITIKPYISCMASKTVNGEQMNVTWHVDDLKVPQKENMEITKFMTKQQNKYH